MNTLLNKGNRISTIIIFTLLIFVLLLSSRVFHNIILKDGESSNFFILTWFMIYIISFAKILTEKSGILLLKDSLPVIYFIFFCFISSFWSVNPFITIQKTVALAGCFIFALAFLSEEKSYKPKNILYIYLQICCYSSLLIIITFPELAKDYIRSPEAWNGIFTHKNYLGRVMVIFILLTLFMSKGIKRVINFTLGFSLLLLSTSAGAFITFLAVIISAIALLLIRKTALKQRGLMISIVVTISFSALLFLSVYFVDFLDLFGKDATLTGRTQLWEIAIQFMQKSPFLGYGFGAFWSGEGAPGERFSYLSQWGAPHSHNGYIDLILDIGAIGLCLFIFVYFYVWRKSVQLYFRTGDIIPFIIFTYLAIVNFVEKIITLENDLHWILFCMFSIYVLHKERKVQKC